MAGSVNGCPSAAAASRQMPMMEAQSGRLGVSSMSNTTLSSPTASAMGWPSGCSPRRIRMPYTSLPG